MRFRILLLATLLFMTSVKAQKIVPYSEIPKMEENYSAQNTVARMIDGLGFRFYWATNCLTEKDLAYKPEGNGRSSLETINHIYDLSKMILRLTKTEEGNVKENLTYTEKRTQTLLNIERASNKVKMSKDLSEFSVVKEGKITIPFFYIINGPIADAIWHTGQVASFRRSSGNPINSKVNHFSGTVRE